MAILKRFFLPIALLFLGVFLNACAPAALARPAVQKDAASSTLLVFTRTPDSSLLTTKQPTPSSASPTPASTRAKTPTLTLTAIQTPSDTPPLQWHSLQNTAYLNEWAINGKVQLADGVYTQKTAPGNGSDIYFQLSHLRIFGDLDNDGAEDALTILMVDSSGPGTQTYLNAVLNEGGTPQAVASLFLGENIYVRDLKIQYGLIWLVYDSRGEGDYTCCPRDSKQYTYRLKNGILQLQDVIDLPDPVVGGRPEIPPQRITFEPESSSATLESKIGFNWINRYQVYAEAGQTLRVEIRSPRNDVFLSIFGESNGEVFTSILSETQTWEGVLPASQDYLIYAVAVSGETSYELTVELSSPDGAPLPAEPAPTAALPEEKVIYLTFDDGPTARWTPEILEVLANYDAKATFFVLGMQVEENPEIISAILEGGHTLGNHSYDHQTFDGITRQGYVREVVNTEMLLPGANTGCLRPPFGAEDAYTRLYAAENGYRTVLWDIDPQDWNRPGVTAILNTILYQVQPGDIVLLHDGGGDRSQTVRALSLILQELSGEGYMFEAVCK